MMKMFFDKDLDYLEVFFEKAENYAHQISDDISEFRAESDDHVVGYAFDEHMLAYTFEKLTSSQKLAILLFVFRKTQDLTQQELANRLGKMDIRQYQRYEAGENATLNKVDEMKENLPDVDFSKILKGA